MSFDSNTPNRTRDAALEYAALGLLPVPLEPGTRKPAGGRGWNHHPAGHYTDPARIARTFRGDGNVGLLMNAVDDRDRQVFAVNVDPRNGGDWDAFVAGREVPPTANDRTPRGGQHFLFRTPPGVRVHSGTDALGPGVNLIGSNGQVVAEPSRSEDGAWTWRSHPSGGIAPAPDWLMAMIIKRQGAARSYRTGPIRHAQRRADTVSPRATEVPAGGKAREATRGPVPVSGGHLLAYAIERFPVAQGEKGSRNDRMISLATSLVCRGLDEPTVVNTLTAWWTHWYEGGTYHSPANPVAIRNQVAYAIRSLKSGAITPSKGVKRPLGTYPRADVAGLNPLEVFTLLFSDAQQDALCYSLILKSNNGQMREAVTVLDVCLFRVLLLLLQEDRRSFRDGLLRFTVGQLREMLGHCFGLRTSKMKVHRALKRWRRTSDRPAVGRFPARAAERPGIAEVVEEVVVGRKGGRGEPSTPSVFRPAPVLEYLLLIEEGRDPGDLGLLYPGRPWRGGLPGPDAAFAATPPAGKPPEYARATGGHQEPGTAGGTTVDGETQEPRVIKHEGPASLKYPADPGLIEVLDSLRSTGRFAPDEWDRAAEWIAGAGRRGQDRESPEGRGCPSTGGLGRAGSGSR